MYVKLTTRNIVHYFVVYLLGQRLRIQSEVKQYTILPPPRHWFYQRIHSRTKLRGDSMQSWGRYSCIINWRQYRWSQKVLFCSKRLQLQRNDYLGSYFFVRGSRAKNLNEIRKIKLKEKELLNKFIRHF